jgi:hypothetical protein
MGYCNSDGQTGYLGELAGTVFEDTDYVFPARNANPSKATYTITLAEPASSKLTFTPKGNGQACYYIKLHPQIPTGIHESAQTRTTSNNYYNLQGCEVVNPSKGVFILNNKKIIRK